MPNEDDVAFDRRARRNGKHHADRDVPPDPRERAIAELKSQVTFLRRELARRDDVLMFLAGMVGPRAEGTARTPDGPSKEPLQRPAPKPVGARDGARRKVRGEAEKPEWPPLPEGYRVVATASDAWVLVAGGVRVAGYRDVLDPEEAARDAWEHHKRNE